MLDKKCFLFCRPQYLFQKKSFFLSPQLTFLEIGSMFVFLIFFTALPHHIVSHPKQRKKHGDLSNYKLSHIIVNMFSGIIIVIVNITNSVQALKYPSADAVTQNVHKYDTTASNTL